MLKSDEKALLRKQSFFCLDRAFFREMKKMLSVVYARRFGDGVKNRDSLNEAGRGREGEG